MPVVLDLSLLGPDLVGVYQDRQATKLTEHLTREHQPRLVEEVVALQTDLRALPHQLYLQVFAMIELVRRTIEIGTLYYVQSAPPELGSFEWVIDAKDKTITSVEQVWTSLVLPAIDSSSRRDPMPMLEGADYSAFESFDGPIVDEHGVRTGAVGTDLRKLFTKGLSFRRSEDDPGLQLIDNLASLVTRTLNDKIDEAATVGLGRLMVRWRGPAVRLVVPMIEPDGPSTREVTSPRWSRIMERWDGMARRIGVPRV